MWYWWFMLACDCITPTAMLLLGRFMWKHCPKEINALIGYRTKRSMKNGDSWKFAHEYCGKLWWILGWLMAAPTVLSFILLRGAEENRISLVGLIVLAVQIAVMLGSIYPTEMTLKKNFHEDGTKQ